MTPNLMLAEIRDLLLAIPAFAPASLCIGYVVGWITNLREFRDRSIVERIIWSIPLSLAVSPVLAYLLVLFFSLNAAVAFFLVCAVASVSIAFMEWRQVRRGRRSAVSGFNPYGALTLCLAILWIAFVVFSLVDFQSGEKLYSPLQYWDYSYRVNWTDSVLIGGVPPPNLLYLFHHPEPMRNYYFWYAVCAVISKSFHLPPRAVLASSCVWVGFAFVALVGLYLKHFLRVGIRLRKQFLLAACLIAVAGLDICALLWDVLVRHVAFPVDPATWSPDPILSWNYSLLWSPHHVSGLVSCMFAFLLTWFAAETRGPHYIEMALVGMALASSFGVSVFVPVSFFFIMCGWTLYRIVVKHEFRSILVLAVGGTFALLLCFPFFWQLSHSTSKLQNGSVLAFGIRKLLPTAGMDDPAVTHRLLDLFLLVPGFALLLGFYFVVLLLFFWIRFRNSKSLNAAHRSLLFLCLISFPIVSFIRSGILKSDDYGFRAPYILQFCLLLLGSELLMGWKEAAHPVSTRTDQPVSHFKTPQLVRVFARLCLAIGILTSFTQVIFYRFDAYLIAMRSEEYSALFAHHPYLVTNGFEQLNRVIPPTAVVQGSPDHLNRFRETTNAMNIAHQTVIIFDEAGCGSEFGGDPAGCEIMAPQIEALFRHATDVEARAVCRRLGIDYLVATVNDPIWKQNSSWVWSLQAVVAEPEFRALSCR